MSNASRCARYYAKRKETEAELLARLARYEARIFSLENHVNTLLAQIQSLTDHVNMLVENQRNHVNTHIEENQSVGLVSPEPRAGARVVEILPTTESSGISKQIKTNTNRARACEGEFDLWWRVWPHKVAKPAAFKAFVNARKKASLDELGEGVRRYISNKPADRQWCNPATWLNGERWNDQPAPLPRSGGGYTGLFG